MKVKIKHKLILTLLYFSGAMCLILAWYTSNLLDYENSYFLSIYENQQTQHEDLDINQQDLIMNAVDIQMYINNIETYTSYGLIAMCFLGLLLIFIGIVIHKYNVVFSAKDIPQRD